jgi:hypothetical protein
MTRGGEYAPSSCGSADHGWLGMPLYGPCGKGAFVRAFVAPGVLPAPDRLPPVPNMFAYFQENPHAANLSMPIPQLMLASFQVEAGAGVMWLAAVPVIAVTPALWVGLIVAAAAAGAICGWLFVFQLCSRPVDPCVYGCCCIAGTITAAVYSAFLAAAGFLWGRCGPLAIPQIQLIWALANVLLVWVWALTMGCIAYCLLRITDSTVQESRVSPFYHPYGGHHTVPGWCPTDPPGLHPPAYW